MEITLTRVYHPEGTNGLIRYGGKVICLSIELPMNNNLPAKSCIPEGTYRLRHRQSNKFGECMELLQVPGRTAILIHPANYALTELRGCIAPVSKTLAAGKGIFSRKAMQKIMGLCWPNFNANKSVYLTITS